jgi:hypothetical protein
MSKKKYQQITFINRIPVRKTKKSNYFDTQCLLCGAYKPCHHDEWGELRYCKTHLTSPIKGVIIPKEEGDGGKERIV